MTKTQIISRSLGAFIAACALALACAVGFSSTAHAQTENMNWTVTYSADKQMSSNYDQAAVDEKLSSMQPGDSFIMTFSLRNQYGEATDWYMASEAVKTLEEASNASDGAYTYKLTFDGTEIYSSDKVGGDGADGFREIGSATGQWFLLGSIESGTTGTVKLEMALDGETQGNSYMDTLGTLNVVFAVEDAATGEMTGGTLTKTNDPLLLTAYAIGILAAAACLVFALVSIRKIRKGRDA